MEYLAEIFANLFIAIGLIFCCLAILGLVRFKTVLEKQHALGLLDTIGISSICIGLAIHSGFALVSFKPLILALIMLLFSAPSCYLFMQIIMIYNNYISHKKIK